LPTHTLQDWLSAPANAAVAARLKNQTGARADRREVDRMFGKLAPGDVVTVTRIDRLARFHGSQRDRAAALDRLQLGASDNGAVAPTLKAATTAQRTGAGIGVALALGTVLFFWLAGSVILGLFVLFTRGPKKLVPLDDDDLR
jgi:Resolvase, N terminal domain